MRGFLLHRNFLPMDSLVCFRIYVQNSLQIVTIYYLIHVNVRLIFTTNSDLSFIPKKSCFDYFAVLNKYMIHVPNTHAA